MPTTGPEGFASDSEKSLENLFDDDDDDVDSDAEMCAQPLAD